MGKAKIDITGSYTVQGEKGPLFSSAPTISLFSDGRLACCLREGTTKVSADGIQRLFWSDDKGRTWTEGNSPTKSDSEKNKDFEYRKCYIREISRDQYKAIYTKIDCSASREGTFNLKHDGGLPRIKCMVESTDGGETWSEPAVISNDSDIIIHDEILADGFLVMPDSGEFVLAFETWKGWDGVFKFGQSPYCGVLISKDQGKTWDEIAFNANDPANHIYYGDQKTCILEDGSLFSTFWTYDYFNNKDYNNHISISADGGRTWSGLTETNLHGQIACPLDMGHGMMLCTYNDRHSQKPGVKAVLSYDRGKTWDTQNQVTVWDPMIKSRDDEKKTLFQSIVDYSFGTPDITRISEDEAACAYYCSNGKNTYVRVSIIKLDR